jgi:hypothetical protein
MGLPELGTKNRISQPSYNHLAHYIQLETGCANTYDLDLTAFINTAEMLTYLHPKPLLHQTHTPTWA